jgi:predicted dehydrogenase
MPYRLGIVGIGAVAEIHARAVREIDGVELVGACCRTEAKGRAFAARHGCRWYDSWEALYRRERLDVVTICTPSGAHLEPALDAFRHGLHVLCEKPLEVNLERARQMIRAARDAGVQLGGILQLRFNPLMQSACQTAASGRFGTLAIANAYVPWWRDDAYYGPNRWQGTLELDGGGALINQSIHAIDAVQWLANAAGAGTVDQVFGWTAIRGHPAQMLDVEDTAVGVMRFTTGAMGTIVGCTSLWPGTAQRVHLAGRDGSIEVHEGQVVTWQFRDEHPEDKRIRETVGQPRRAGGASDPTAIEWSDHRRNIGDFLDALTHHRSPAIDGIEAIKALAIIRAIYDSAAKEQPVRVPNVE